MLADHQPGIWRYADHLPLADLHYAVSLGEGNTPLLRAARIGMDLELPELYFKLEGSNPTGSYKDRIAAVGNPWRQAGRMPAFPADLHTGVWRILAIQEYRSVVTRVSAEKRQSPVTYQSR